VRSHDLAGTSDVPVPKGRPEARPSRTLRRSSGRRLSSLSAARGLVELYADTRSPKYERAALKYLGRHMDEADPSLADVAQVAALLAERALLMRGL
jgi:hypothetical protein